MSITFTTLPPKEEIGENSYFELAERTFENLFGEVGPPLGTTFTFHQRWCPAQKALTIELKIIQKPGSFPSLLEGQRPPLPSSCWSLTWALDQHFLRRGSSKALLTDIFCLNLEAHLMYYAHRWYERDPRIGWTSKNGTILPVSRLLDPLPHFSRTGHSYSELVDHPLHSRCLFCGQEHTQFESPMWGGGNLRWIHPECWRANVL